MSTDLMGIREIATLLRVSRQRADQLSRTEGFPPPAAEIAQGRIWDRPAVFAWAFVNGRLENAGHEQHDPA